MIVHLNAYSDQAYDLISEAIGRHMPMIEMSRMPDNEIYIDLEFPWTGIEDVIEALHKTFDGTTRECLSDLLCHVLGEEPREQYDRWHIDIMKGKPLDPMKAAAIEALQRQTIEIQNEYEKKIDALYKEEEEKLDSINDAIDKLRGVGDNVTDD